MLRRTMTVNTVTTAIRHAHQVIGEWEEAGRYLDGVQWREDHTRYALIDPILRALGWKTYEPRDRALVKAHAGRHGG